MKQLLKSTSKSVTFFCMVLTFLVLSCSKSNDATPSTTSAGNGATIDGTAFAPTTASATNTGTGLNISLKDGTKEIALSTSDKVAGTYAISNTVPSGRMQATLTAVVSYFDGTDLYFGSSGTIVITIDASGKASGTFTATFKSVSGKTIELKDGKFTTLAIGSLPSGKCLVSGTGGALLEYDGDGKLIKLTQSDISSSESYSSINYYFYLGGLMTNSIETDIDTYQGKTTTTNIEEKRTYTSGKVTRIVRKLSTYPTPYTYDIEYNAAGQISKLTSTLGAGYVDVSVLEYNSDGNVVKNTVTENYDGGTTTYTRIYSNYDNKPNLYLMVAQAMGAGNQLIEIDESVSGEELSKNNVGTISTTRTDSSGSTDYSTESYQYEYNAKGYVTKTTDTYCYNPSNSCDTNTDVYTLVGCN